MGWEYLWILAVVSAVLCAVGFYKFVYFLSIGYGFAIAGLGVAILILFRQQAAFVHVIQCLLFLAYGARLSGFLLYREIKNAIPTANATIAATALHPNTLRLLREINGKTLCKAPSPSIFSHEKAG